MSLTKEYLRSTLLSLTALQVSALTLSTKERDFWGKLRLNYLVAGDEPNKQMPHHLHEGLSDRGHEYHRHFLAVIPIFARQNVSVSKE